MSTRPRNRRQWLALYEVERFESEGGVLDVKPKMLEALEELGLLSGGTLTDEGREWLKLAHEDNAARREALRLLGC